jgi:hypothetical protein
MSLLLLLSPPDLRTVWINTTASDTGREEHPWVSWSDTSITLDAIDKQGLTGTTFYCKVRTAAGLESGWFGPFDINAAAGTNGYIKVWTGSAWVAKPLKVWDGSAWNIKPVKHWNGSWTLSNGS